MCQWILQQNDQIVPRRTLRRLRPIELSVTNEAEATKRAEFDAAIKEDLGDSITPAPIKQKQSIYPMNNFDYDDLDEDDYENFVPEADAVDARGSSINQKSVADLLINAELLLTQGEAQKMEKVVRQYIERDGNTIGDLDKTPSLHSLEMSPISTKVAIYGFCPSN